MIKVFTFLIDGFEPSEAIVPIDFMRRAKFDVTVVSLMGRKQVNGSQGVSVVADSLFDEVKDQFPNADLLFLPGGPKTVNYLEYDDLKEVVMAHFKAGKKLAAICAAPMVFGRYGILKGEKATCYPGFEGDLEGAEFVHQPAVVSGQFITGAGAGAAVYFGFKLVEALADKRVADLIRSSVNYQKEV
ncbi:MAG: DJ-1/PfpI family protein [Paludibacteraceae bacterium]|nr:DJ-1/PfpI family protein [Paludibacteraceae bacterium]